MKKYEKRLLLASGIAAFGAAAFAISSYFFTKKMVEIALKRDAVQDTPDMKKSKDQLRGYEDSSEFLEMMEKGKAFLYSADTKEVSIEADDGTLLMGHLLPCENEKRLIIAMHGWRSSWVQDFGAIAKFWHKNGCSVLFCEQRGQGLSGGDYMGFGLMERYDCAKWVSFAREEGFTCPIYLAGLSMGAATVLMAANLGIEDEVAGIMADCAYTSPHAIWKHVVENNLRLSYGLFGRIADDMCRKKIQVGSKDFSTVDAMLENKIPTLFIHGSDDHFVPVEMTYENYKACASEKKLLIVPGADHGMCYFQNKEEYEKVMLDFFHTFDKA